VSTCQCQGIESQFDRDLAASQLRRLRARGPQRTTRLLVEAIRRYGVAGRTVLDIGGGVGAILQALLASDATAVTDVDASTAYIETARAEADRLGWGEKARFLHGNFVELAPRVEPADIVTLDRVICCYDDMESLVAASAERARGLYGLVFPRSSWVARVGVRLANAVLGLRGDPFRIFVHPTARVDGILRGAGLSRVYHHARGLWQVSLYAR